MNFSNLSPAERMKASGLIGLIVVLLFFVVHTMMGVVAPKKATAPEPGQQPAAGGQTAASASASPTTGPSAGPSAATAAFPTDKIASARRGAGGDSLDIHDPFVPLNNGDSKPGADTNDDIKRTPKAQAPVVNGPRNYKVGFPEFEGKAPAPIVGGLPNFGSGPQSPGMPTTAPAPPAEPEIRVVGIVHGDPSVATLQVSGHMVIARPGDVLAKGWRLMSVNSEGVQVRHQTEITPLRVGTAINESKHDEAKK